MSAEQLPPGEGNVSRFPWSRRRAAASPAPASPVVTHIGGTAVDPVLVANPVRVNEALASGTLQFVARLHSPAGEPLVGETVLFTIAHAARTTVKCAAITDHEGVARAQSMVPLGLFDRGPIEFRVGFAGAPPRFWPISITGQLV